MNIDLEFPVYPKQRWTVETPHEQLDTLISANRDSYAGLLKSFLAFAPEFARIPAMWNENLGDGPFWTSGWFAPYDMVALYGMMVTREPGLYMEVGSGNSTKWVRRAIDDHALSTQVISIDPEPRAEIDPLCEEIVRTRAEDVPVEWFDVLKAGDILFIDGSHYALMNSDVTALFLDVFPRLPAGVIVQVHDICLPYDYPATWTERWYSEQYILAAYLLGGAAWDIVLPMHYVMHDSELNAILDPLWTPDAMHEVERSGSSFWMVKR